MVLFLSICQVYKDATLFFSQDSVETIAHVIPTMDHINKLLHNSDADPLNPSVKAALKFAHKSMDKYYSKTDMSNVYQIAMGILVVYFWPFLF
jgi:hypothetical protein